MNTGMWLNLSRAYEVAKVGDFSIKVVYQTDYVGAAEDYQEIKAFFKDVSFSPDGDLIVEIQKPAAYTGYDFYETLEKINKRVKRAIENKKPTELSEGSVKLLKVAADRLDFSLTDSNKVQEIASVIAQIHDSNIINFEHVAEAVNLRAYTGEGVVAENPTIMFGKGISITKSDIEPEHVNAAIKYLQSLQS